MVCRSLSFLAISAFCCRSVSMLSMNSLFRAIVCSCVFFSNSSFSCIKSIACHSCCAFSCAVSRSCNACISASAALFSAASRSVSCFVFSLCQTLSSSAFSLRKRLRFSSSCGFSASRSSFSACKPASISSACFSFSAFSIALLCRFARVFPAVFQACSKGKTKSSASRCFLSLAVSVCFSGRSAACVSKSRRAAAAFAKSCSVSAPSLMACSSSLRRFCCVVRASSVSCRLCSISCKRFSCTESSSSPSKSTSFPKASPVISLKCLTSCFSLSSKAMRFSRSASFSRF